MVCDGVEIIAHDMFGQTEVRHMRFAVGIDENVPWCKIPMQNSLLMRGMHRPRRTGARPGKL
jgi:hypothetical protein